jgi:hypothetical protein
MRIACPYIILPPESCSPRQRGKDRHGQVGAVGDSSGGRGHQSPMGRLGRTPSRVCVQPVRAGTNEKTVQNITKERYIKVFDSAVVEVMERLQATMEFLEQSPAGALEGSC